MASEADGAQSLSAEEATEQSSAVTEEESRPSEGLSAAPAAKKGDDPLHALFFLDVDGNATRPGKQPNQDGALGARLAILLDRLRARKKDVDAAIQHNAGLDDEISAGSSQAQATIKEKLSRLKSVIASEREGLLSRIQQMEESKLQQVLEFQRHIDSVQQKIAAQTEITKQTLAGSASDLLEKHAKEVNANSDVLAIDLAMLAPAEQAKLYRCSLSQSTLKQQLSGLLKFDGARQSEHACNKWLLTSEEKLRRASDFKAKIKELQQQKSQCTADGNYLEASQLKHEIDKLRVDIEALSTLTTHKLPGDERIQKARAMEEQTKSRGTFQARPFADLKVGKSTPSAPPEAEGIEKDRFGFECAGHNAKTQYLKDATEEKGGGWMGSFSLNLL